MSILSGILLAISWPEIGNLEFLIFFALLPVLWVEKKVSEGESKRKAGVVFLYAYLTFFIFNFTTTSWIRLASFEGMIMAEVFNALFMALIFMLFHLTKRNINEKVGYASLVFYWLAFEYLHTNWDLSWIWLNLGNVFANRITWIQWYEYTGTLGGTFWILGFNTLLFYVFLIVKDKVSIRIRYTQYGILGSLLLIPILSSMAIYYTFEEQEDPIEIVLVQPNIDPYNDKFDGMTEQEQIDKLVELSEGAITPNTELIFGPETAFPVGYWESELDYSYGVIKVTELLNRFPKAKYVVGLSSIRLYRDASEFTPTSRPLRDGSGFEYDYYNSVMQMDGSKDYQIYRKKKLVLGVEKMPFIAQFDFMKKLSIDLGGASGSLGSEKEPKVFVSKTEDGRDVKVIPAICYESIYGEFLTEFVKKGGNLLGVVTNDGWWGNTSGYHQHLAYSRLRAIELRRSVARSANTGISAFINQKGEILQRTEWWTPDAIRGELNLNNELTFYARHGDYLGRMAAFVAVLLLIWTMVKRLIPARIND